MIQPAPKTSPKLEPQKPYSPLASLAKSATILSIVIAGVVGFLAPPSAWMTQAGDTLSEAKQKELSREFSKVTRLPLKPVSPNEVPAAVESMNLSPSAKQTLLSDISQPAQSSDKTPSSNSSPDYSSLGSGPTTQADEGQVKQTKQKARQKAQPVVNPSIPAIPVASPLRLAWITLWDSQASDGDTILIDCEGFSKTVVLTKEPVTLAIPVVVGSNVKITGIHDGGGGITVGVSSADAKLVFPVMSVGQVLSLGVQVD